MQGSTLLLDGSGSYDNDGSVVSYLWTDVSSGVTYSGATLSIANVQEGTRVFSLLITDNDGATDTDNMTLTVSPPTNLPPSAFAGEDFSADARASATPVVVTLDGTESVDDGLVNPMTYSWAMSKNDGGSNLVLSRLNTATPTFEVTCGDSWRWDKGFCHKGDTGNSCEYEAILTVDDGEFTDTDSVIIEVDYSQCNFS